MPRAGSTPFALAILFLLCPAPAEADLFVTRGGESVVAVARRAVIAHDGGREALVEELEVTSTAPHFVWFRAFPIAPQVDGAREELFRVLEQNTKVEEPFNEEIRRNLFGPSVVTLLTRRLATDRPPSEELPEEPLRDTTVGTPRMFTGKVTTSSITFELVLPTELELWLIEENVDIGEDEKRELARYLNRGWVIVGAPVSDAAPSESGRARLGPIRFDFAAETPLYPQIGVDRPWLRTAASHFYLLAETPLAPAALRTVWDARSWEPHPKGSSQFVATYSHRIDPEGTIAYELQESALPVSNDAYLVRASYERGPEALVDLSFIPAQDAVVIPGSDRRASATDIFLCILLGLTPLIYTPESWFLLWLAARAKARARKEGRAFGTRLWSLYAIVVAIFWFATLEGAGRLAALFPMLIGIVQLAIPYTEREPSPIRVQFKKRKPRTE